MRRIFRARMVTAIAAVGIGVQLVTLQTACAAPGTVAAAAPVTKVISNGVVDATAYRKLAKSMASTAGIAYRFGLAATTTNTAGTVWQSPSKRFVGQSVSANRSYQVAGPQNAALSDYSSDQGQVGYLPASGSPKSGVDTIETLSADQGTFSEQPQLSWTYYGGGHPSPEIVPKGATGKCITATGRTGGTLVAQARAYSHGEATANSILAFDNGVIATAGTNTAPGQACTTLPSNLRPTDISVTNGNEFALVTAWNLTTLRSELVVVALGGKRASGDFWNYEWSELYPGFRNYGRPTFMKVLGSITLPMRTATSVSAVSNVSVSRINKADGNLALPGDMPLSVESNRQLFASGLDKGTVASAGYAVVASREEKKVSFVDLQPLFREITRAYLGSRAKFDSITGSIGQGANQWPYAFSAAANEKPVVLKTISLSSAPSAVAGMLSGGTTPRAYVATANGTLRTYSVSGLATTAAGTASGVKLVGTIKVGSNPTDITYVKDRDSGASIKQTLDNTLIVTSRGARAVQWVKLSGNSGSIVRTLKDSRLVDPISSEDNNTHGTESYVLTIADFGGSQVRNYRYGPVVFHTNGGARYGVGPSGTSQFEYGGAYSPGGRPFSISVTNVT